MQNTDGNHILRREPVNNNCVCTKKIEVIREGQKQQKVWKRIWWTMHSTIQAKLSRTRWPSFKMFGLNKSATYLKKLAQFLLCRKTETIAPWCRLGWLWLSNTTAEPFGRKQRAMLSGWWTNTPAYVRLSAAQICHVACTVKRIDVGLLLFQATKNRIMFPSHHVCAVTCVANKVRPRNTVILS